LFERAERSDRAVILHPVFPGDGPELLDEFCELARSAGVEIVDVLTAPRDRPDARYFVGKGKIEELAASVEQNDAGLILFSRPLSAIQERNIEKRCQRRVLDRNTLILDIFAQRAQSYEGKLEVELAQLRHLSTRLVRGWTHLERQKGGIGLRGPGETQLETDRRLVGERIRQLRARLDKVHRQRTQSRRRRQRSDVLTVALVGYTNAGKSTLFNRLTESDVDTRDMQFATLDPTVRKLADTPGGRVLMADTVGFVSSLPPELIAAFRATLLESREADLLLHVVDVSDPFRSERRAEVESVLESIGASKIPAILVYNKIDKAAEAAGVHRDDAGRIDQVWLSARDGRGVELLRQAIMEQLQGRRINRWIRLGPSDARLRAQLFELGAVSEETVTEGGAWRLHVDLSRELAERLARQGGKSGSVARDQLLSSAQEEAAEWVSP
jgi:GTP-binding protein HflX